MKALVFASALSLLAIAPAAAQSCVSGGQFVPCGPGGGMQPGMMGGGAGMQGGMQGGGAGMANPGMAEDQAMKPRRKASRKASRKRTARR